MGKYHEKPIDNTHYSLHKEKGGKLWMRRGFCCFFSVFSTQCFLICLLLFNFNFFSLNASQQLPHSLLLFVLPLGVCFKFQFQFFVLCKYHFSSLMFVIISVNPPDSSPAKALNCMVKVSITPSPMLICLI